MAARDVVDENQIEIRGDSHLTAAKLAKRNDSHAITRQTAMLLGKLLFDARQECCDGCISDIAEACRRFIDIARTVQQPDTDLELAILGPASQNVQPVLKIIAMRELLFEIVLQVLPFRHGIEKARAENTVQ